MQISCPGCGFKGTVPDEKIPESGRNLTCPKCTHSFFIMKKQSQQLLHDEGARQRDWVRCVYCGAEEYLEFYHIIPFSEGGLNAEENIQLLCRRCHAQKGAEM